MRTHEWDATLVSNVVGNCQQQIDALTMKMPMAVTVALSVAYAELARVERIIQKLKDQEQGE